MVEILKRVISSLNIREMEVETIWKPQLHQLTLDTCNQLNIPNVSQRFTISYNEDCPLHAQIYPDTRHIEVGNKFFTVSSEHRRLILQHEIAHIVLPFTESTENVKEMLCGIPLYVPLQWRLK